MLNHKGTITLETERLFLRRFEVKDIEDAFYNWCKDEEVTKYLSWPPHSNTEVTKNIIESWINNYESLEYYNWAIELKETSRAIGSIGVVDLSNQHRRCEIGYCIGKEFWGKGIMTEALKAVISFAVEEIGIVRVQAMHNSQNVASGKVMLKAGMKYEGRLYSFHIGKDGLPYDCDMYSITSLRSR